MSDNIRHHQAGLRKVVHWTATNLTATAYLKKVFFLTLHRAFWRFTYYHLQTNALIIIYYLKSVLIIDIKTLSYLHSSYMFRHITCHPQGALIFLAKITHKTTCKTWTYIVWRLWQHIMDSRVHTCSVCYCAWWYVDTLVHLFVCDNKRKEWLLACKNLWFLENAQKCLYTERNTIYQYGDRPQQVFCDRRT
jgi:hypothetical protein